MRRLMSDLFPASLEEMIACVVREIRYRERVYAQRIEAKSMTQALAAKEIAHMTAVLKTLRNFQAGGGK